VGLRAESKIENKTLGPLLLVESAQKSSLAFSSFTRSLESR